MIKSLLDIQLTYNPFVGTFHPKVNGFVCYENRVKI